MKSFFALCLAAILASAGTGAYFYNGFAVKAALPTQKGEWTLDVTPQSTFNSVKTTLASAGVRVSKIPFKIWALSRNANRKLRPGEYTIQPTWTQMQILEHVLTGEPVLHKITIKEGHSIWDLFDTLKESVFSDASLKDQNQFRALMTDKALVTRAGVPPNSARVPPSLEGFLFPETYSYQKYDAPRKIIESMIQIFETRALPILKEHPWGSTPEGRYRLLTLASVVEKESGVFAEQPLIASVFWNRLKKRMKLQSDPTIIYGLQPGFDGNIHKFQILAPTPYNTYTVPELPVGPISNPGESALRAVVHPAQSDYLFFVAKGDGTHAFSKDLQTHNSYVQRYQIHHAAKQ